MNLNNPISDRKISLPKQLSVYYQDINRCQEVLKRISKLNTSRHIDLIIKKYQQDFKRMMQAIRKKTDKPAVLDNNFQQLINRFEAFTANY